MQGLDSALTHALTYITAASAKKNKAATTPPAGYTDVNIPHALLFHMQSLTLQAILGSLKRPEERQRFGQDGFGFCLDIFAESAQQAMQAMQEKKTDDFKASNVYPHWRPFYAMKRGSSWLSSH